MCTRPPDHPFYLTGKAELVRQGRFCWLCDQIMTRGVDVSRVCRCGNGFDDYHIAHNSCAIESTWNTESPNFRQAPQQPPQAAQAQPPLPDPIVVGVSGTYRRYEVTVNGDVVWADTDQRRADGVGRILEEFPEAARVILTAVRSVSEH